MDNITWDQGMRREIYRTLKSKFGPHATWGARAMPKGKKVEFKRTLEDLAESWGYPRTKWEALHNQMRWAATQQLDVKENYFSTMIENMRAALVEDFLQLAELPDYAQAYLQKKELVK